MNIEKIIKNQRLKTSVLPLFIVSISAIVVLFQLGEGNDVAQTKLAGQKVELVESLSNELNATNNSVTKDILGFNSKLGALPSSLNGTVLGAQLEIDEDGHLLLSDDIKDIFDYFLSTINEEDLDSILMRIDEYLSHYLVEPALGESKEILAQYVALKSSLYELEKEMGQERTSLDKQQLAGGQYLDLLRDRLDRRNALREEYLSTEINEIFFHEEERYDEYTYSRLRLNSNKTLSPAERNRQLSDLQSTLPEGVRQSMRNTQIIGELQVGTETILADGGGQEQVRALRVDMFGEEAAQRFDTLDQERALWQSRMDDYLTKRAEVLGTAGLADDVLQDQVASLRNALFEPDEHMKVRVFERRSDRNSES